MFKIRLTVQLVCFLCLVTSIRAYSRVSSSKPAIIRLSIAENTQWVVDDSKSPIADEIDGWDSSFYQTFLSTYWGRKPLLIRNAFEKNFFPINSSMFLTKLAADDDVESRLIIHKDKKWLKEYGPFDLSDTESFPRSNSTILFQEVDRHVPRLDSRSLLSPLLDTHVYAVSIAAIWTKAFNFVPEWRRDDIMVSYATPNGGIGAHVDDYDVFLIQGR